LLEVNDRSLVTEIVAAVLSGEGIDGVGAELSSPRGFRHGFLNGLADPDLIHAHGGVYEKRGHAGVLANGALVIQGHVDVA
jgi:hypothetical protein